MRFRSIAVLLLCASAGALAQSAPPGSNAVCAGADKHVQDACQQAVDMYQLMMPQLGVSITGGNATLGQGGTLGGLPHFALDLRGNAVVFGELPKPQTPDTSGIQARSPYPTENKYPFGLPAVDAAIGVFKGLPLALTNVGGVDLLLSAAYIPNYNKAFDSSSVNVAVKSPLKIGYGLRVGLLQESLLVPGLSVTYFKRDLPVTTIAGTVASQGTPGAQDSLIISNFTEKTTAWRIVASKSLLLFGLAAGFGQDKYQSATSIRASVTRDLPIPIGRQTFSTSLPLSQDLTRTNMFADATLNLFLFKLVAEVGRVSGGTVATVNQFDPLADVARNYASAGLRIGF